jgi:leader peptidase (prepilin peptidase) / N-methyltransferase
MDVFWLISFSLLGLCVGSFLNVVIWRMPRGESIVFPGSHCPGCGRAVRWYDNIPILSWLYLRGKCRFCKGPISPRYLLVEATTGLLLGGLYACYYILEVRSGVGAFNDSWLMFLSHAALLCGLLACAAVDIDHWIVPLEICWFVSLFGIVAATAMPPSEELLPRVGPVMGAAGVAMMIGIGIGLLLLRWGLIRPSFIDADDKAITAETNDDSPGRITSVAADGQGDVNPRIEVLHEVLFLLPAILLGCGVWALAAFVPAVNDMLLKLADREAVGGFAKHLSGFEAALVGYLAGGGLIWAIRILGTLGFGKEAMGLGDAHLLAAVGAVAGYLTPTLTFFAAPLLGLAWALWLFTSRKQRELPYGPWLAVAAVAILVFHDSVMSFLSAAFGR